MPKSAAPTFPLRDAWLAVVPLLPLMLFTGTLATLIDPAARLQFLQVAPEQFIARPQLEYVHLGDMLTYYSLAALHTLLCVAVIVVFIRRTSRLPRRRRDSAVAFLGAILLLLVAVGIFFERQADDQVLVQLGFKATCGLLEAARLSTHLTAPGCFGNGISRLTWLAWLPTFSGMAAVAVAAAFAYGTTCVSPADAAGDRSSPAWRETLEARVKALQHSVYLLSAVLVSSTITITQFSHLPVGLLAGKDGDLSIAAAAAKFAAGLSTFWGALFSLTLVATFAVPAMRLFEDAYGEPRAAAESADLQQWLDEHVFQSVKRQLGTVLSLLAPLLVGPLSSLLSSFSRL
jgi:hypothetical protein